MSALPTIHRFSAEAMATSFEVLIADEDTTQEYAARAAEAVFEEIRKLEEELSRFRPSSDIYRLSQAAPGDCVPVSLGAWDCLHLAKAVFIETEGAFDVTVGPLMHLWRTPEGELRMPDPELLEKAKQSVGSQHFDLEESELSVTINAPNMVFDLGAIGKGYALDQAALVLENWSLQRVFLNAGDSTLLALQPPPGEEGWEVTLAEGEHQLSLVNRALSGSGFHVKGAHIMNPRTLQPVALRPQRTYALAPTAALSDALSTAFMILSEAEAQSLCSRYAGQVEFLTLG